jgi:hypothetical protein
LRIEFIEVKKETFILYILEDMRVEKLLYFQVRNETLFFKEVIIFKMTYKEREVI